MFTCKFSGTNDGELGKKWILSDTGGNGGKTSCEKRTETGQSTISKIFSGQSALLNLKQRCQFCILLSVCFFIGISCVIGMLLICWFQISLGLVGNRWSKLYTGSCPMKRNTFERATLGTILFCSCILVWHLFASRSSGPIVWSTLNATGSSCKRQISHWWTQVTPGTWTCLFGVWTRKFDAGLFCVFAAEHAPPWDGVRAPPLVRVQPRTPHVLQRVPGGAVGRHVARTLLRG